MCSNNKTISHIVHYTLSCFYNRIFCGGLMWVYNFGRVAVEWYQTL
jgi:hypothetical protein